MSQRDDEVRDKLRKDKEKRERDRERERNERAKQHDDRSRAPGHPRKPPWMEEPR